MRITLPPSNYPPTAPYAKLSDHFAKLVKSGLLKTFIIKMLLYPQSRQSIDMETIPLRKKFHKSSKKFARSLSHDESDTSAEKLAAGGLERQDAFSLPTDSESGGSAVGSAIDGSNDFDFMQYSKNDSMATFIDHGSGAATPKKTRHCSSINLINLDSASDDGCDPSLAMKKESLVIGSKTMRAIARKSSEQSIIIHTSKAHLAFGVGQSSDSATTSRPKPHLLQQQTSETSGQSSVYGGRLRGAYIACENLTDLSDETKIKDCSSRQLATSPQERHSMPNMFVGNRFNRSSKTAVYVPSWQDRSDMQNQSVDNEESSQDCVDGEVHATSTLDLPAMCREAPDKLQAELLYNFNDHARSSDVIAPPSMYKTLEADGRSSNANGVTISQTELCFEPKRNSGEDSQQRRNSVKRCISYHYVPLAQEGEDSNSSGNQVPPDRNANRRPFGGSSQDHKDGGSSTKCKCCESSQCPSPRSSDSGMAGSCTINSPDPPQSEGTYEPFYDVDGNLKLLSNCSNANDDLTRFDVCGTFREKFFENSQQPAASPPRTMQTHTTTAETSVTSLEFQRNSKSIFISSTAPSNNNPSNSSSHFTFTSHSNKDTDDEENQIAATTSTAQGINEGEPGVFRSGMYAHWWKKETLPHDVVRSIAKVYNKRLPPPSNQTSIDSRCSQCSSCFCSLGASGYSEGATYCSLCQDCISTCSSSSQQIATNTTTTITSAECPLCCNNISPNRNSEVNTTTVAPSHSLLSSPASSVDVVDCPICSGNYLARVESLSSGKDEDDFVGVPSSSSAIDAATRYSHPSTTMAMPSSTAEGKQNLSQSIYHGYAFVLRQMCRCDMRAFVLHVLFCKFRFLILLSFFLNRLQHFLSFINF